MGYAEAAARQARVVPVASARMQSDIECRLTSAHQEIDRGRLDAAAALLSEIEDLLHRAIECGALVDPRNILGFDAQFSLFPAVENSCHDHRVDELLELMDDIFALYARLEKEAAAAGETELRRRLLRRPGVARSVVGPVRHDRGEFGRGHFGPQCLGIGRPRRDRAGRVVTRRERRPATSPSGGTTSGKFRSAEAHALVVEALLDQHDLVAAMALLMHWLSQSDEIPLVEGNYSFHELALRWMSDLWRPPRGAERGPAARRRRPGPTGGRSPASSWTISKPAARRSGKSPAWSLSGQTPDDEDDPEADEEPEEDAGGLFGAAYENVTLPGHDRRRLRGRDLRAVGHGHRLRIGLRSRPDQQAAGVPAGALAVVEPGRHRIDGRRGRGPPGSPARLAGAGRDQSPGAALAPGRGPPLSTCPRPAPPTLLLAEFDRRQSIKEMLLDRVMIVAVETADAARRCLRPRRPTHRRPRRAGHGKRRPSGSSGRSTRATRRRFAGRGRSF